MKNKEFKTEFLAFQPRLKPGSPAQGGGFTLSLDIPENQWKKIKELNDPALKQYKFVVKMEGEAIK